MPFADELIGPPVAQALVRAIRSAAPHAELPALRVAPRRIEGLPLRRRADLLRDALLTDLPGDHAALSAVVCRALAESPDFSGWLIWPVTEAVATRAVREGAPAAFDEAMALLADLTGRLTSEFAVRIMLRHDLDRALGVITDTWVHSADVDVRRLASEGTRPYLPWATRVPGVLTCPGVTVPILDALHHDGSEYVRRSVANHLNDLSRDHPALAVGAARRWLDTPAPATARLVRHGLRTLVKRGDRPALDLLGFTAATLDVDGPHVERATVPVDGSVRFTAAVVNTGDTPARLAIDYVIHRLKADGGHTGRTFKLTTRTLAPGERAEITREHSFRPISTRRHHPGRHAVSLRINGVDSGRAGFELTAD
ncbi:DNA alkylation repair protein [Streptomyces arboris]|uniref:DNA alkylation repair protein n=1 Tax=Streptomyces arboris TaxID=2600619 RepID=UPI003C2F8E01